VYSELPDGTFFRADNYPPGVHESSLKTQQRETNEEGQEASSSKQQGLTQPQISIAATPAKSAPTLSHQQQLSRAGKSEVAHKLQRPCMNYCETNSPLQSQHFRMLSREHVGPMLAKLSASSKWAQLCTTQLAQQN
jgi:hypothetical protein